MSKSKVITLTIIGVLLAMSVLIGVSYSLWRITLTQETANTLTTSCFDVTFTEDNNISLQNAYPLYDEDGKKLTPYTFTIQNNCEAYATYNIQLEVLSSSRLASEHLKIQINEEEPVILNTLETGEVTLSEADEAYILGTGTLNLSEGKTYTLRVWLDEDVTLETEGVQNTTWSAKVTVNSSYTDEAPTAVETILAKGETDELKYDDTVDQNLRYIGADPNNYVYMGERYPDGAVKKVWEETGIQASTVEECNEQVDSILSCTNYENLGFSTEEECNNYLPTILEETYNVSSTEEFKTTYCVTKDISNQPILWRIIGVMNNIDDGTGNKETRLKIIRNESIGRYTWDNKPSGTGSSTGEYGSNDWSDSRLMMLLNPGYETPNSPIYEYEGSLYYNGKSGTCYSGSSGATVSCDFTDTGLKSVEAKSMIDDAVWNLGGMGAFLRDGVTSWSYTCERGTEVYSGHTTEWTGKIGLMYASDYGYATSGGQTASRDTCLNIELPYWSHYDDCFNNNWLLDSSQHQWTLSPSSANSYFVFVVQSNGGLTNGNADEIYCVRPTLYLASNVKISGGEGTESSPYQLSL